MFILFLGFVAFAIEGESEYGVRKMEGDIGDGRVGRGSRGRKGMGVNREGAWGKVGSRREKA